MFLQCAVMTGLLAAAGPATRVAVVLEDAGAGSPAVAAIEATLQEKGYSVVAPSVVAEIRKVVAPKDILENRLPTGLSVFEADALIAGTAVYSEPTTIDEGVSSQTVVVTVRLIDLGTGQATATVQGTGVSVGVVAPTRLAAASRNATRRLFSRTALPKALEAIGPTGSSVMLVVQGLPHRTALSELKTSLEKALAGAPAREVYFAQGLGKLELGGSRSPKAMTGPDIADIINDAGNLALSVVEVANTRIVAEYDRSRTVRVHALVLEPKLPRKDPRRATQLGKYVATQVATFDFARASYQRGRLNRKRALKRARRIGADVIVESEVLNVGRSSALLLRVIDVASGRPIMRQQQVLDSDAGGLEAARTLLANLKQNLPEKLTPLSKPNPPRRVDSNPTAAKNP